MSLFRKQFTVTRPTGSYVKGKWVPGGSTTITIMASVQPLKGLEIQLVPEARRYSQSVKLYTNTQLQVGINGTSENADILSAFGFNFEIISVEPWQSGVMFLDHYKCIGVKAQ
jgi:hypothetical protein